MVQITDFDASAFLDNDEVVAEYLSAALEEESPEVFLAAVGHVAKARGMTAIANEAGPVSYTHLTLPTKRIG